MFWGCLLTPALKARVKLCLENWGILLGFLVVCGCDVQQESLSLCHGSKRAPFSWPYAQIQRWLEWRVLDKKVGEEGKATAAQSHLAASDGFHKSMHSLLKPQEMQIFSCHIDATDRLRATISLATHPGQLSSCTSHVLLLYWEGPSQGWAEPGPPVQLFAF